MELNFVVFHSKGPSWPEGGLRFDHPEVQAHAGYFGSLFKRGDIILGGPFPMHGGGMMIFRRGMREDEVRSLAQADPAVQSGVMAFEVKPWMAVYGKQG